MVILFKKEKYGMNKKPPIISPSLLSADLANLSSEIKAVEDAGADWLHIDVMDGHFVPNLTMGPAIVASIKKVTHLPLDVHLMIENPQNYISAFTQAGADILTVHIETLANTKAVLDQIHHLGIKAGLSLRPSTPVTSIMPFLKDADLILVMTVNPGFSGQKFIPESVKKIEAIRKKVQHLLISVDGGVNAHTKKECVDAGANVLVAGDYIFKNNYKESIATLKGH